MDIQELQAKVIRFRDNRDWAQYHNPKDLAISLSLEAAELLEIFQWKDTTQVEGQRSDSKIISKVKEELGDVFIYALTLAYEFGLNPSAVVLEKLRVNEEKYPADKVKGRADKYTAY
jgi:NTP pyrophosphatase (non-canonical NTP hydrolase)